MAPFETTGIRERASTQDDSQERNESIVIEESEYRRQKSEFRR
jgi:hypothetical protein